MKETKRPFYTILLGIFHLQVASSPKTWDSKPTCLEERS